MTSFLTALLTRVLCKSLVSINVHNRFRKNGNGGRDRQGRRGEERGGNDYILDLKGIKKEKEMH